MASRDFDIGFVGLGQMGRPMVRRLVGGGLSVVAFDVRSEAVASAVRDGASAAGSAAEVADAAPMVLVSLPSPDAVETVALGPWGLVEGSAMLTYVDLSTTGPSGAERIAAALARRGVGVVDAPVSGGVRAAEAGSLTIMLAGEPDALGRAEPALARLGTRLIRVGSRPGQGQTMKLINNVLSATAFAVTSEALVLGARAGLDAATMLDVLNASTGRNNATSDKFPKYVLPRTFDFGFGLSLMAKDVGLYAAEARRQGLPSWVATAVNNLLSVAMAEGFGDRDATSLVQLVERWGGVTVSGSAVPT